MLRLLKIFLVCVVTIGILALMVYLVGYAKTLDSIRTAGVLSFLAVGCLQFLFMVCHSASLAILSFPLGHRISFRILFEAVTVGLATNFITPSTYLGGEPVKVIYLGGKTELPYGELAGTVVLAKYMEVLSFVLFLGMSTAVSLVVFRYTLFSPPNLMIGIAIMLIATASVILSVAILLALLRRQRPLTALVEFVSRSRFFRRFFAKLRSRTYRMEQQILEVFLREGRAALRSFFLYLLAHVILFLRPLAFFGIGWHTGLDFELLCLIFIASQLLLAIQITPSSVGLLDGGLIGILYLVGADTTISDSMTAAYLLCLRLWDVMVIGGGAWIAARSGVSLLFGKERP